MGLILSLSYQALQLQIFHKPRLMLAFGALLVNPQLSLEPQAAL